MHKAEGRSQTLSDALDPARVAALMATLGQAGSVPDHLPEFAHHLYFWDPLPPRALGRDGHPQVGGFIPDLGLSRRMWAGGRLSFHAPLTLGQTARRHSTITKVARKSGRSGALGFVTLRHEYSQDGKVARIEEQDLLYRHDPTPDSPAPLPIDAPLDEEKVQQVHFDTTLLFRYSALTFNGHRIHYDLDYAQRVEGYPGLVVHGPLLAQKLVVMAVGELGMLSAFKFRATAPLFHFETAELCLRQRDGDLKLWVRAPDGRQCMVAEAA